MNTKRILMIEDDAQIGNLEQEVLEQHGYACVRAYSGTEALLLGGSIRAKWKAGSLFAVLRFPAQ